MGNPSLPSYTLGQLIYNGFPSFTSISGQHLYVIMSEVATPGTGDPPPTSEWAITACVGGGSQPTGTLGTLNSRGAWAATTAYALWDTFTSSGITYLVVTGYTSGGSFGSTDVADTCVLLVSGTGGSMSYTTQSVAIPVGTNLSTISVTITANPPLTGGLQWVELGDGSEPSIYIQ
jgi:hypothetical protein